MAAPKTTGVSRSADKRAFLQGHPIFGALEPELLDQLSSYAIPRSVRRGTLIFARGDAGTSLFAICSGTVKIGAPSADGKDAVFNLVSDGAIFGEIAVLDGLPRSADAMALTDCEFMVIERRDFVALIRERAEFAVKLIEVLCRRLRHTTGQLEDVMFLDLPARLAKALLQEAKNAGSAGGKKIMLTQRNLSEMIGMSRESTNKQLRAWEKQKLIELQRGSIVILAPSGLETIASTAGKD
ncbi:MAG: cyclic nucleotide-binding domain-containing protein [Rhizobiales bacterium]|nr:cyclic nucleotide-binding domain-containing protein [Hyphomicrobiales bacterium]